MKRHDTINKWWSKMHAYTNTRPRYNRWAFVYGLLSGIPICCAEWWALKGGRTRRAPLSHRLYKACPDCRKTGYAVPLYLEKEKAWAWAMPGVNRTEVLFKTRKAAMRAEPKFRRMFKNA
jgi:hypothetical protein